MDEIGEAVTDLGDAELGLALDAYAKTLLDVVHDVETGLQLEAVDLDWLEQAQGRRMRLEDLLDVVGERRKGSS